MRSVTLRMYSLYDNKDVINICFLGFYMQTQFSTSQPSYHNNESRYYPGSNRTVNRKAEQNINMS